jgi:hypothetical protein
VAASIKAAGSKDSLFTGYIGDREDFRELTSAH